MVGGYSEILRCKSQGYIGKAQPVISDKTRLEADLSPLSQAPQEPGAGALKRPAGPTIWVLGGLGYCGQDLCKGWQESQVPLPRKACK